jgi:hypothetical protein
MSREFDVLAALGELAWDPARAVPGLQARRAFIVSMLMGLVACGGSRDEVRRDLSTTNLSGEPGTWPAGFYEARDDSRWQAVWRLGFQGRPVSPPLIDFDRHLVVGVAIQAASFCDEVLITGAAEEPNALRVNYRLLRNESPGCFGSLPRTRTVFALIEPLPKPVVFVEVQ